MENMIDLSPGAPDAPTVVALARERGLLVFAFGPLCSDPPGCITGTMRAGGRDLFRYREPLRG
jgi:hypothetical protein